MVKVSFVIPAYKRRFLSIAIESILAQTYKDIEIFVVDDCSPQNLKEVVDKFHDPRLTYVCNEQNIGGKDLVGAWNKALSYATGEWVVCPGDDDCYEPEFVEEMLRVSAAHPEADVLHCRLGFINEVGELKRMAPERKEFESQEDMIRSVVLEGKFQVITDFMYRRSALLAAGGYANLPQGWYADWMTAIQMSKNGAGYSPRCLAKWRASDEQITSRSDDGAIKVWAVCKFRDWLKGVMTRLGMDARVLDDILMHGVCSCLYCTKVREWIKVVPRLPYWVIVRLPRNLAVYLFRKVFSK